jgi:hypothetical protein
VPAPAGTGATAAMLSDPKLVDLEKTFRAACKAPPQLQALWKSLDVNINGVVSLAEIDRVRYTPARVAFGN